MANHFTKMKALDEAIKLSKKEKCEVVVYSKPGTDEFHYCQYGDYGLPDSFVLTSFVNGEEIDFGNE